MINKIIAIIGTIFGIFTIGFLNGRKSEKNNQLNETVINAKEAKQREIGRSNDDITTVRKRLSKYVRK